MKIVSEVSRSVVVGILGTILNLFLLFLTTEVVQWYYLYGALLANIITLIFIFVGDKYYTFRHGKGELHVQVVQYVTIYVLGNLVSLGLLAFFVEFFGWHYLVAQALATTLVSFFTFLIFKYWIFHCHDWL